MQITGSLAGLLNFQSCSLIACKIPLLIFTGMLKVQSFLIGMDGELNAFYTVCQNLADKSD